jgi:hypothetical protein
MFGLLRCWYVRLPNAQTRYVQPTTIRTVGAWLTMTASGGTGTVGGRVGREQQRVERVDFRGYTRQQIAADLVLVARELLTPEQHAQVIGDAAEPNAVTQADGAPETAPLTRRLGDPVRPSAKRSTNLLL